MLACIRHVITAPLTFDRLLVSVSLLIVPIVGLLLLVVWPHVLGCFFPLFLKAAKREEREKKKEREEESSERKKER